MLEEENGAGNEAPHMQVVPAVESEGTTDEPLIQWESRIQKLEAQAVPDSDKEKEMANRLGRTIDDHVMDYLRTQATIDTDARARVAILEAKVEALIAALQPHGLA